LEYLEILASRDPVAVPDLLDQWDRADRPDPRGQLAYQEILATRDPLELTELQDSRVQ